MAFDPHNIFAYTTVASVTSQTGTTLIIVVQTGDGALFSVGQQVTLGPTGSLVLKSNGMIGRITAIAANTLTIDYSTANKEGSNTRTVLVGDIVVNSITPKALTDIEALFPTGPVVGTTDTQTLTNKTLTSPVFQGTVDGWILSTDTLVFASATSFTIAGVDRTTTYTKGTRVKFTNNSITYYGTVASSSFSTNTTVNLAPTSDFTIANSAITNPYYSYQLNPQGFPSVFSFTTTWAGFSVNPTGVWSYWIFGNICRMVYADAGAGTSNATTTTFTAPVAPLKTVAMAGLIAYKDNGSNSASPPGHLETNAASTTIKAWKSFYQGAWTSSGSKDVYPGFFEFAF